MNRNFRKRIWIENVLVSFYFLFFEGDWCKRLFPFGQYIYLKAYVLTKWRKRGWLTDWWDITIMRHGPLMFIITEPKLMIQSYCLQLILINPLLYYLFDFFLTQAFLRIIFFFVMSHTSRILNIWFLCLMFLIWNLDRLHQVENTF